jgi:hypothetical protein
MYRCAGGTQVGNGIFRHASGVANKPTDWVERLYIPIVRFYLTKENTQGPSVNLYTYVVVCGCVAITMRFKLNIVVAEAVAIVIVVVVVVVVVVVKGKVFPLQALCDSWGPGG